MVPKAAGAQHKPTQQQQQNKQHKQAGGSKVKQRNDKRASVTTTRSNERNTTNKESNQLQMDAIMSKILYHMASQIVIVQIKDGSQVRGVLFSAKVSNGKGIDLSLKQAKIISRPCRDNPNLPVHERPYGSLVIPAGTWVELKCPNQSLSTKAMGSTVDCDLATDDAIRQHLAEKPSANAGMERELVPWCPDGKDQDVNFDLEQPIQIGEWDQFKTNKELYGVESSFNMDEYSIPVNQEATGLSNQKVDELVKTFLGTDDTTDQHRLEERILDMNQMDSGEGDEEEKYSAVSRAPAPAPQGDSKATPASKPQKQGPAAPAWTKPSQTPPTGANQQQFAPQDPAGYAAAVAKQLSNAAGKPSTGDQAPKNAQSTQNAKVQGIAQPQVNGVPVSNQAGKAGAQPTDPKLRKGADNRFLQTEQVNLASKPTIPVPSRAMPPQASEPTHVIDQRITSQLNQYANQPESKESIKDVREQAIQKFQRESKQIEELMNKRKQQEHMQAYAQAAPAADKATYDANETESGGARSNTHRGHQRTDRKGNQRRNDHNKGEVVVTEGVRAGGKGKKLDRTGGQERYSDRQGGDRGIQQRQSGQPPPSNATSAGNSGMQWQPSTNISIQQQGQYPNYGQVRMDQRGSLNPNITPYLVPMGQVQPSYYNMPGFPQYSMQYMAGYNQPIQFAPQVMDPSVMHPQQQAATGVASQQDVSSVSTVHTGHDGPTVVGQAAAYPPGTLPSAPAYPGVPQSSAPVQQSDVSKHAATPAPPPPMPDSHPSTDTQPPAAKPSPPSAGAQAPASDASAKPPHQQLPPLPTSTPPPAPSVDKAPGTKSKLNPHAQEFVPGGGGGLRPSASGVTPRGGYGNGGGVGGGINKGSGKGLQGSKSGLPGYQGGGHVNKGGGDRGNKWNQSQHQQHHQYKYKNGPHGKQGDGSYDDMSGKGGHMGGASSASHYNTSGAHHRNQYQHNTRMSAPNKQGDGMHHGDGYPHAGGKQPNPPAPTPGQEAAGVHGVPYHGVAPDMSAQQQQQQQQQQQFMPNFQGGQLQPDQFALASMGLQTPGQGQGVGQMVNTMGYVPQQMFLIPGQQQYMMQPAVIQPGAVQGQHGLMGNAAQPHPQQHGQGPRGGQWRNTHHEGGRGRGKQHQQGQSQGGAGHYGGKQGYQAQSQQSAKQPMVQNSQQPPQPTGSSQEQQQQQQQGGQSNGNKAQSAHSPSNQAIPPPPPKPPQQAPPQYPTSQPPPVPQ